MSNAKHNTTPKAEHGATPSYVTGFILSLIFTIIPYYLVANHVIAGMAILVTILGFALLQMAVQIIFFLHLGRQKSPNWQLFFFISTFGIILVVVVASIWIMHHLHHNMTPVTTADVAKRLVENEGIPQIDGKKTGACEGVHTTYKVTLKGNTITPSHIDAHLCDRISFINEDKDAHYIMFGSFEQPRQYGGEDMLTITNRRAKTIVLNELGTHHFHDHMNARTTGDFAVTPN